MILVSIKGWCFSTVGTSEWPKALLHDETYKEGFQIVDTGAYRWLFVSLESLSRKEPSVCWWFNALVFWSNVKNNCMARTIRCSLITILARYSWWSIYCSITCAAGTVASNRKYIPNNLKNDKTLPRGEFDYRVSDGEVVSYKYKCNKILTLLSNFHVTG